LADHDHHGGEIWWEKSPHRLCKRDTVSEKLNKAENYPDAKICLPQGNHPECLLPVNGRENSLFFQAKKKAVFYREMLLLLHRMGPGTS
jgi:hypothetical protein